MTSEHQGRFALLQPIFAHQCIDDPRFFEFDRATDDLVEIEQHRLSCLFVDFERPGIELCESLEATSGVLNA